MVSGCEGEKTNAVGVVVARVAEVAGRVLECGEELVRDEAGDRVFGLALVGVVKKAQIQNSGRQVHGPWREEFGEWVWCGEDVDVENVKDVAVGVGDLNCKRRAVAGEGGLRRAAHIIGEKICVCSKSERGEAESALLWC